MKGLEANLNRNYVPANLVNSGEQPLDKVISPYSRIMEGTGAIARRVGAITLAGLLAGCSLGMNITGRDTLTEEEFYFRVGQQPREVTLGRVAYSILRPVTAVVDGLKFDLYSDFTHAIDRVLCQDNGLHTAAELTLPKNLAEELYKQGCMEYSEKGTGDALEKLTEGQKDSLTAAVKDELSRKLSVVTLASNDQLVALPATYEIGDVTIEEILHPWAREGITFAGDVGFWYGVGLGAKELTKSKGATPSPSPTTAVKLPLPPPPPF